jgi:hypothetical protein
MVLHPDHAPDGYGVAASASGSMSDR